MIRYKQGIWTGVIFLTAECSSELMESSTLEHTVIYQIIKILLKVKLLGLPFQPLICDLTLGKVGGEGSIRTDAVRKNEKGTLTSVVIAKKAEVWFFFPARERLFFLNFLTEQFVHGYIRTHRKQEVISVLPIFQGNRLHPRSHSILYIVSSSSGF